MDGEQVKGGVTSELAEAVAAEQRDATDAINRDRIPRQYQQAVKEYFSYVQKALGQAGRSDAGDKDTSSSDPEATGGEAPESDESGED